jgi:hypothetical protein
MARGWGYAIDYDKEIALDEAEIARLDHPVARAVSASLTSEEIDWIESKRYAYTPIDWLWYRPELLRERAAIVRLSPRELELLAALRMDDVTAGHEASSWISSYAESVLEESSWYREAAALGKQFENLVGENIISESRRATLLKKAKSDLSRHRRNKAKHGD